MNFVNEHIAIGNADDARDYQAMRNIGIRFIVNLAQEIIFDPPHDFVMLKAGGVISGQPILPLVKLLSWLTGYLNAKVLVHCAGGWNRSPALVVCYLMDTGGMSEADALKLVAEKRPGCAPTMSMVEQWKIETAGLWQSPQRAWRDGEVQKMSIGAELKELLDEQFAKSQQPLIVAETGCIRSIDPPSEDSDGWSTLHLAQWAMAHTGSEFHSMELHPDNVIKGGRILGEHGIPSNGAVRIYQTESVDGLKQLAHIDFAYLDTSDDLAHGLAEFQAAEEKGARTIVMDDRETKCLAAIAYARESGRWDVQERARLTIMRRK
jgi:hypothetical protein